MAGDVHVARYEQACVVPDDPGQVVRHAGPLDERARHQLLEQHIARLVKSHRQMVAVARPSAMVGNTREALLRRGWPDRGDLA